MKSKSMITKSESGFTLVELMIVLVITAILTAITASRFDHMRTVNSINEDIHRISAFIHSEKIRSFTQKRPMTFKVVDNELQDNGTSTVLLTLNNTLRASGTFTITSRGIISVTNGNISVNAVNTGAEYSCILLDNIRTRLGVWDGTNCNPI